jgi:predicted DNA-binding protein (MmcQ/YjbR family)
LNAEQIRDYCLKKAGVEESFPFDEQTLVFKVNDKMFLLLALEENPPQFNVKCDPEEAEALREKYRAVRPGFHMNKKHWNTVVCDGTVPKNALLKWIDDSYDLVKGKRGANTRGV